MTDKRPTKKVHQKDDEPKEGLKDLEINKIILGDCLSVMKDIPNESIDLVVTDPPYGINYQSAWRIDSERFDVIDGDTSVDLSFIKEIYRILKDGCAIYVFTRWDVYPLFLTAISNSGFIIKNCIVWDRIIHGLGDLQGGYAYCHDFIIFASKGRHILKNGRPKDIIRVKRVDAEKLLHPTQKPVELIRQLIENSSKKGDIVLDPFIGSGTTALACKQLNRKFIGIEISEDYFNVANKRLEQQTLRKLIK